MLNLLNYRIIHKDKLRYLEKCEIKVSKLHEVYRWFSGWKDLNIIWDYIISESYVGGISEA